MWKLEDTWVVSSLLPPYGHVGPRDCTQIVRFDSKCFYHCAISGEGDGENMNVCVHTCTVHKRRSIRGQTAEFGSPIPPCEFGALYLDH